MVKKFISYYKPHKKIFMMDMLCAFAIAMCDLVYPMITRHILNNALPDNNLRMLITFSVALFFIYVFKMFMNYFVQYWGHVVGVKMQATMRLDIFKHLQKLPFGYFANNKTGVLMSKIINDLMDISELAHHGPEDLFISLVTIFGSFILLANINLYLTLIIFAFLPLLVWFSIKKRLKMITAFKETRVQIAEVNASIENSISGIRVVKAFNNAEYEIEKFKKDNGKFVDARSFAYKAMAEFFSGTFVLTDLLNVVVLLFGGYFTIQGHITIGDFAAYFLYIGMFLQPIRRLIGFVEQFQSGSTGFERFLELMDELPEENPVDGVTLENPKGSIEFKNVSFNYEDDDNQVLENLDLNIPSGKTVALVGPSGGGKTTICNLIPRFYTQQSGSILIDGIDNSKITLESLRSNIGIVQQDVFLFTGTIKENLAYGKQNATMEEITAAAQNANIHDFIMSLPDGYDTFIGERGVKLSGGQKQRLSIARVFLKDPAILILDEATSALDNTTEMMIQNSLNKLCHGRTTIVVAHRLSTVKNADEIVVLGQDGIEEKGTHDDLIAKDGRYAELYNLQFKEVM